MHIFAFVVLHLASIATAAFIPDVCNRIIITRGRVYSTIALNGKKGAKKGGSNSGGGFGSDTKKKSSRPRIDDKADAVNRALLGMSALQSPSLLGNDISLVRLFEASKKLVVGPSKVSEDAGLGLFLADDAQPIEAGDIITFYAVHGLGYACDDGNGDSASLFFDGEEGGNEDYVLNLLGSRPLLATPSGRPVNFGDGSHFMINADPHRERISGWFGQMINDGAALLSGSTEKDILTYYQDTGLARNVVLVPFSVAPIVASVATRRVVPGEELLTSYGCQYWLEAQSNQGLDIDEEGITDNVLLQAREVAMEVMTGAKSAAGKYGEKEGRALASLFGAARDNL